MKSISHNLSVGAAVVCAVLFLAPSPASSDGLTDFLGKFNPSDPCDWSGFYLGVNVGGSWNHFDFSKQSTDLNLTEQFYDLVGEPGDEVGFFTTFNSRGSEETDGQVIGGVQGGFNLQFGHFVLGAEGSFVGNNNDISKKSQGFQENELFLITEGEFVTAETSFTSWRAAEMNWNGFIGGRLAYCWNRLLFYGTGGVAFAGVDFNSMERADTAFFGFIGDGTAAALAAHTETRDVANLHPVSQQQGLFLGEIVSNKFRSESDVLTGWYAGVGTEYKLTTNTSLALEYRHADWGDNTGNFRTGQNGGPIFPGDSTLGLTGDQVVLKFNYMISHFNPFH
jgi:outer membrane immunogenic protein